MKEKEDETEIWYLSEVKTQTKYMHYYRATAPAKLPNDSTFEVIPGDVGPTYFPAPKIQLEPCPEAAVEEAVEGAAVKDAAAGAASKDPA